MLWLHSMLNSVESDTVYPFFDFNALSRHVSVIRYNACDQSPDGNYSWDNMSDELIQLAMNQKLGPMILSGSSMGAGTAIHCAVKFPELVKALILVTPPPAWKMRAGVKTLYEKIARKADPDKISDLIKKLIANSPSSPYYISQNQNKTQKTLLEYRLSFDPAYYSRIYLGGAASDFPSPEKISGIKVPTWIIAQSDDENHPLPMAQELNKLISGSELSVISNYNDYLKIQEKAIHFIGSLAHNNKS